MAVIIRDEDKFARTEEISIPEQINEVINLGPLPLIFSVAELTNHHQNEFAEALMGYLKSFQECQFSQEETPGILLEIDSQGGSLIAADQFATTVRDFLGNPVAILITGHCASAAIEVLRSVSREYRFALPSAHFMTHYGRHNIEIGGVVDPAVGEVGREPTIDGLTEEELVTKIRSWFRDSVQQQKRRAENDELIQDLAESLGTSAHTLLKVDHHFSAYKAKELGLIGHIIEPS